MVVGDGGCEAYTAIVWGVLLSRGSQIDAEAETVRNVEGNMCGPVMRGTDALPWSENTSRTKGSRRNLGDLVWPAVAAAIPGRGRKARSRRCRGTGEESDEPRSTCEAPEQGRDERRRRAWREGARSEGWQTMGDAPGTGPEPASCARRLPADRRCGVTSALARSRPTFGGSPVRESRTPGSVRGAGSNPCPYRDRPIRGFSMGYEQSRQKILRRSAAF